MPLHAHAELDRLGVDRTQPNYALRLSSGDRITHNRFVMPDWGTLRFDLHVPNPRDGQVIVSIKGTESANEQWQDLTPIQLTRAADPHTFNDSTKGPNWVSWQLNTAWLGGVIRTPQAGTPPNTPYVEDIPSRYGSRFPPGFDNNFPNYPNGVNPVEGTFSPYDRNSRPRGYPWVADQSLPTNWVKTQGADYQNNTLTQAFPNREFDRGHMTPFNDRTRTFKDALSTYLTTNLLHPHSRWRQRRY